MTNELYHHGIKGQKWGVRHGPPYPIDDNVMRKGTKINSVSTYSDSEKYRNRKAWTYTYNPDDDWDSKIYKGPFSVYRIRSTNRYVFEHQFEVVDDLKMPTRKERIDEFIDLYNRDAKTVNREMTLVQRQLNRHDILSSAAAKVNFGHLQSEEDFKAAYEVFNHAMENVSAFKTTKAYADAMAQKFDAMVDDNNQGIYNGAHDPVIIFRADQVLKEIGPARMVEMSEIADNYREVARELQKKGESVKL